MNNNLQPKTNEYFEIVACDENGKRATFANKQAETLEEVEKIIAEAYTYSDQMTDENRAYWDKQTYAVQKVVHIVTPYNEKLITKADQSVGFEREPGSEMVAHPVEDKINAEEIKRLVLDRGLTLTDMIDVVCELNGFVGVGYITFGDQIGEYIKAKASSGLSKEAWLNS